GRAHAAFPSPPTQRRAGPGEGGGLSHRGGTRRPGGNKGAVVWIVDLGAVERPAVDDRSPGDEYSAVTQTRRGVTVPWCVQRSRQREKVSAGIVDLLCAVKRTRTASDQHPAIL